MLSRYPQYRFTHLTPGLVKSELFADNPFPQPLRAIFWILLKTPMAALPDQYAPVPTYIAVDPIGEIRKHGGLAWGVKAEPVAAGKWASVEGNRARVWDKLVGMVETA